MGPQEKLKLILDELKEFYKKHDIGGVAFIHTQGYGKVAYEFCPSYSCIQEDEEKRKFIVNNDPADYSSAAAMTERFQSTTGMLATVQQMMKDGLRVVGSTLYKVESEYRSLQSQQERSDKENERITLVEAISMIANLLTTYTDEVKKDPITGPLFKKVTAASDELARYFAKQIAAGHTHITRKEAVEKAIEYMEPVLPNIRSDYERVMNLSNFIEKFIKTRKT